MQSLEAVGTAIFVSPNAVEHGLALLGRTPSRLPRIAAVGESTAIALEAAGLGPVLRPADGASSETLLALPELQSEAIAGSRVLIVRGVGGRELLGETLSKRGALVAYAEVYRRARPEAGPQSVAIAGADAVVITSVAGLDNLFALAGDAAGARLRAAGYVVASERIARHARGLGVAEDPVVAAGAGDAELVEGLLRWRAAHPVAGE
ncbi:MAG: uroporphyrinogen-III synthase [Gammaproteobacteria bacterium]|nr:uroporphyrinogen-III synthase [Gammaproteobacteria bacterium]